jgi:hypothetical protein
MASPPANERRPVSGFFQACSGELDIMRKRLLDMEQVLLPELMGSPRFHESIPLQEALQQFDWLIQHLGELQQLLSVASLRELREGGISIGDAIQAIRLAEVAERMASALEPQDAIEVYPLAIRSGAV